MLYMPEGYWHYMKYVTPGFSMSLRAFPRRLGNLSKAAYNVFIMRHFDNLMRRWKGQKWIDYKNEQAIINTHKNIKKRPKAAFLLYYNLSGFGNPIFKSNLYN